MMSDGNIVTVGDLRIDVAARKAWLCGAPLRCERLSIKLLALMALRKDTVVTKRMVLRYLYPKGTVEAEQKIIDIAMCHLRKVLPPGYIETVWGRGSILRDREPNRRQNGRRWTPGRKAEVVAQVRAQSLSLPEAYGQYEISPEEFLEWDQSLEQHGIHGLFTTRVQEYARAPI
jgi:DNA-binding winged helix-turn-helix (wHTH) protein